jgi:hypothetical protein
MTRPGIRVAALGVIRASAEKGKKARKAKKQRIY